MGNGFYWSLYTSLKNKTNISRHLFEKVRLQRLSVESDKFQMYALYNGSSDTSACSWNKPFFFAFFFFLGPLPRRMEVPRLGVQLKLQPLAYTRATAMPDPSRVCDLHHSSQQRRILNILSKARDRTGNLMVPSRIC